MAKIAVIDDDLAMDILVDSLRYRGHDALRVKSAEDAFNRMDLLATCDLVVLDIIMPWPEGMGDVRRDQGAGMEILIRLREKRKDVPVIVLSATQDESMVSAIKASPSSTFLSKWNSHTLEEIVERIGRLLRIEPFVATPRVFIVHGRDETTKLQLKNYLQNTLKLSEPTILHEQPNRGRTIIEKFEDYAASSSIVFVILTPDDQAASTSDPDERKQRARQNVIFELGFFLGGLGRGSGRVILLHKGPIELPSDLAGVVYIDVSNGVEAAGEMIRREVQNA